jgi:RimJ/RimL family protein N-acetyltransferase
MDFTLRPFHITDADLLPEYANNFNIARYLMDVFPHPYHVEHAKTFIKMATKDDPVHIFAIDIDGRASGAIGLHLQQDVFRKNAELGYWLAEPFWGKGIMTRAVRKMIDFGFDTYDINRIFARPFSSNLASQRVLEKSGFRLEARLEKTVFKNGEFLDELIFATRKE